MECQAEAANWAAGVASVPGVTWTAAGQRAGQAEPLCDGGPDRLHSSVGVAQARLNESLVEQGLGDRATWRFEEEAVCVLRRKEHDLSCTGDIRVSHGITMRALVEDRGSAHEGSSGLRNTKATNVAAALEGFRRQRNRQGRSIVIAKDSNDMPVVASPLRGIGRVEHR